MRWRSECGRVVLVAGLVVINGERTGQGHVAAVGDRVAVVEDVTHAVVGGVDAGLVEGEGADLGGGDRQRVGRRGGGAVAGGGHVGHLAGIEVGLGDGVAGGAGDRGPRRQSGGGRAALVAGLVVINGERTGQGHVAAVGDRVAVVEDVTHAVVGGVDAGLVEGQGAGPNGRGRGSRVVCWCVVVRRAHRRRVGDRSVGHRCEDCDGDVGRISSRGEVAARPVAGDRARQVIARPIAAGGAYKRRSGGQAIDDLHGRGR